MTRGDLAALQERLSIISTAAEALAEGQMEPEISLRADQTVITCLPVVGWGDPGPVVIEERAELPASVTPVAKAAPALQTKTDPSSPPPPSAKASTGGGKRARPAASGSDGSVKMGPLTVEERAEILQRHGLGQDSRTIGKAMNRKASTIGLFIAARIEGKGAPIPMKQTTAAPAPKNGFRAIGEIAAKVVSEIPAGQPAEGDRPPEAAKMAPTPVGDSGAVHDAETGEGPEAGDGAHQEPPAQEAPVAGGASTTIDSMPGGERGGLQQHSLAEKAPVQPPDSTAESAGVKARLSPVEAPKSVEDRRILDHLQRLAYGPKWTVEDDLEVCEAFQRGSRLDRVALEFGVDAKEIKDRYQRITAVIRDDRGHLTIDGQERILRLLRQLVAAARKGAA